MNKYEETGWKYHLKIGAASAIFGLAGVGVLAFIPKSTLGNYLDATLPGQVTEEQQAVIDMLAEDRTRTEQQAATKAYWNSPAGQQEMNEQLPVDFRLEPNANTFTRRVIATTQHTK